VGDLPSVIGRYEIISRLGQGGMGSLYLAKDPKIGRLVAIKLVRQEFDSPEARQRFAREAQSAGTLRHPNIVTIFDVDEHDSLPYIAMEYVDGETLSEIVRRKAPHPIGKRLQWIEELCSGLAYAHRQGVVHRDIKPANLMLDNEGALKILDFGLARREASKFTQSQTIIGTPNYMSPEQIRAGDVGPRSDIFAVGAVLYELLTCKEAFPGRVHEAMHKILYEEPKPIGEVIPSIDAGIGTILARALEKDPARRFADLTAMRTEVAVVRQRIEHQMMDGDAQTALLTPQGTAPRRSGSAAGHVTPLSGPGSTPGSAPGSGGSRRLAGSSHRVTLQKKRAAQIDLHLVEARKYCDAGAFDKAREAVEQALMFDPDHPTGLQLIDEIAAEEERQQIAQLVAAARVELQHGRLDAAEQIVAQALEVAPQSPEVLQLRQTIDTARREIERARQVQDMLRRARTRFSEGSFEGAIRAVGELLAIDPGNSAARDLQARAQEAIDTRAHRVERDTAAQAVVTEARALFEKGDKESAIAKLEAFTPPHDLVSGFLASLRGEQVAEALQEPAAPTPFVSSGPGSGASPLPTRSRTPIYAGVALAGAVLVAGGWYVLSREGGARPSAPPEGTAAKATSTAPPPVIPPPAVVTPPASLRDQAPKNQNDRDAMAAYKLLSSGQHVEAAKIVAQVARRDPKNENLKDLREQIQKVSDTEKQRAKATAAAATVANAPATGSAGPASSRAEKPAAPSAGGDTGSSSAGATADKSAAPPVTPPPPKPEPAVTPAAAAPAPPVAVPPAELERPSIEASINEYARALSSMNLRDVAKVRRYTQLEAKNWENTFKQLAQYRLIIKITGNPTVNGDHATIPVEEVFAQTAKKGGIQVFSQARKTEYKLEKIGGKWMLLPPG
jgi:tetratricopeptide (TPR) repeat protein